MLLRCDFIFSLEYRNCYVMNAAELLQSVPDVINTKVSGLLIGCIIDTSIGELSFLAAGQDTGIRFRVSHLSILELLCEHLQSTF